VSLFANPKISAIAISDSITAVAYVKNPAFGATRVIQK
jgi:hypothetical protein